MGKTNRPIVESAEAILGKEFAVLNHGFVRLVDYLGGDARIVQSARVSYGDGTKKVSEDRALIDYLMRHRHTSPFEQVVLTTHLKMPIFVARQWIRHRTARMNEISGRYSVMRDEFYVPKAEDVQFQSADNKQGRARSVPAELAQKVIAIISKEHREVYANYTDLLNDGIAKELARINLPLSLYTEFYWQMDLHNLFHFLGLRMEPHAQFEIREYASHLAEIARAVAPMAYESFENHQLNGMRFSGEELACLQRILKGDNPEIVAKEEIKMSGARKEFLAKLEERLGIKTD